MSAVYPILIWKPSQKTIATKHRHSNTFSFHSMNHWRAATRRPTRATDESFVKSSSKTGRSRGSQPRIAAEDRRVPNNINFTHKERKNNNKNQRNESIHIQSKLTNKFCINEQETQTKRNETICARIVIRTKAQVVAQSA